MRDHSHRSHLTYPRIRPPRPGAALPHGWVTAAAAGAGAQDTPDVPVLSREVPRGSLLRTPAPDAAPSARTVDGQVGDWSGTPSGFGGTLLYSKGEFVYQDHIWDAYGADDGGDAQRLVLLDHLADTAPD